MNFQIWLWLRSVGFGNEDLDRTDWDPVPGFEGIGFGAQMRVIDVELSTPASSDPPRDESFHALQSSSKNLNTCMRRPHGGRQMSWESHGRCPKSRTNHEAFAARWYRGESRHRHRTRRFTQVLAPLCLEVKTYSCFLLLREPTRRIEESTYRLQWWWFLTLVSRRSWSQVV